MSDTFFFLNSFFPPLSYGSSSASLGLLNTHARKLSSLFSRTLITQRMEPTFPCFLFSSVQSRRFSFLLSLLFFSVFCSFFFPANGFSVRNSHFRILPSFEGHSTNLSTQKTAFARPCQLRAARSQNQVLFWSSYSWSSSASSRSFYSSSLYSSGGSSAVLGPLPRAFMDITISGQPIGRLVFELFEDEVPRTVKNFQQLCCGGTHSAITGLPLHYKGSSFHRIILDFMCQGGDFTRGDGTGGESIYGERFADENFVKKHTKKGLLSMANAGPNTNSSQFFITLAECPWLDGRHTVFGQVVEGMGVLNQMAKQGTPGGKVLTKVAIADSGMLA